MELSVRDSGGFSLYGVSFTESFTSVPTWTLGHDSAIRGRH